MTYKCAAPLQSSGTEAVYTVNKQTQVAGAILFLMLHSSGKDRQLQRYRAQVQQQKYPPLFVYWGAVEGILWNKLGENGTRRLETGK